MKNKCLPPLLVACVRVGGNLSHTLSNQAKPAKSTSRQSTPLTLPVGMPTKIQCVSSTSALASKYPCNVTGFLDALHGNRGNVSNIKISSNAADGSLGLS